MILDNELYLTPVAGQLFNPTTGLVEYGSKPVNLMADAINVMKGRRITVYGRVKTADVNNLTNYYLDVVQDDDGAGTNGVSVLQGGYITKLLAALEVADGVFRIGVLDPTVTIGAAGQYLTAKVTQNGTDPTTGLLAIWLVAEDDAAPQNEANIL